MKRISWQFPIPRTHCGIPLGNGLFGALIWGKDRIHITVSRADFWDHRGGQRLEEGMTFERLKEAYDPAHPTRMDDEVMDMRRREKAAKSFENGIFTTTVLPMGRFELCPRDGWLPVQGELEPHTGRARISFKKDNESREPWLEFMLSPEHNVLLIRDPDRLIEKVEVLPAWKWVGEHLARLKFSPPEIVASDGVDGWAQNCPADPSMAALCKRTDGGFLIAMEPGADNKQAIENSRSTVSQCEQNGTSAFLDASARWWRKYWRGVPAVKLPAGFFRDFLDFALYKFACATNPHSPLPAALQGPWIEEYQMTPWCGAYVYDINVQEMYMPAFPTGHLDHLLPLFDMLDGPYREVMRLNARTFLGIEDGLLMPHYCDDRGFAIWLSAPGMLYGVSGWVAQLYWLYYRYTGDIQFLRERAYPFMSGVMRCFEEMLEEKDGRLSLPIGASPEYHVDRHDPWSLQIGRNPSFQLACIHMLATALLEAAAALNVAPRPIWSEIKARLPPYSLISGHGPDRIAVWDGVDLAQPHVHHSHLIAIYPFDSLGAMTPEQRRIVDNSLNHWMTHSLGDWNEWSVPLAAIIMARSGMTEAPMFLMDLWRRVFLNEGQATIFNGPLGTVFNNRPKDVNQEGDSNLVYRGKADTNEIMQLDGTMGAATAIYECLCHTHSGVTRIFPAIPQEWKDVSFSNILAPGPCLVSAKKTGGIVREVKIKSIVGGRITCDVCGVKEMLLTRKNTADERVTFPVTLVLKRNEIVGLTPV